MSVSQLDTPLERLAANPTGMNWRDLWDPTTQYYLNDVAVSPVNNNSYILTGKVALLGGADPTANPDWGEISPATTGVDQVIAGNNITLGGTPTLPVINAVVPIVSQFANTVFPFPTGFNNLISPVPAVLSRARFTFGNPPTPTAFYNSIVNATIADVGVWCVDLQSVCFQVTPAVLLPLGQAAQYIQISIQGPFQDTSPEYIIPPDQGGRLFLPEIQNQLPGDTAPYVLNGGKIWFNPYQVKVALGGAVTTEIFIYFKNFTATGIYWTAYGSSFLCTYFPNGIQ
jgi:hypothetical protein